MKKINKNIESMLYDTFLNKLIEILHLKVENIYFFQGELKEWEIFRKTIEEKKVALIYNPKIQLNIKNIHLPIILSPGALLYYKNKFSCFLFSESLRPGNIFFSEFTFYYYWLNKHLLLDIQDLVIFWKPSKEEKSEITYSFTLPRAKTLTKDSPNKRISIHKILGLPLPSYKDSWFSKLLTKKEYSFRFETVGSVTELEIENLSNSCEFLTFVMIHRMSELEKLAKLIINLIPDNYVTSEWFKKIEWKKVISLNSLDKNKKLIEKFSFFSSDTNSYRTAISFIFPNYSLLTTPIVPLPKALLLGKELQRDSLKLELQPNSFDFFLSHIFSKKVFKGEVFSSSIFSREGKKLLYSKLLSIEWKVYFDFESYSDMLTQTSLQIFQGKNLIIKKDLIFNPEEDYSSFEEECILELSRPILKIFQEENIVEPSLKNFHKFLEKLSKKIVYIAFNKTFECQWLQKLSENSKNSQSEILSLLIKDLTVDLCDWFIFSKNKSLNLIGELQGTHSLKRLSTKVLKDMKQYSSLEHVQEGRGAQFLFLYYFFILKYQGFSKELLNEELSPRCWVKNYREKLERIWQNIKTYLTEYCSLDVQGMVWAVEWLEKKYESKNLVEKSLIQDFISWIKLKNPRELKTLISNYLSSSCSL